MDRESMMIIESAVGYTEKRAVWVEVELTERYSTNMFVRADAAGFRTKLRIADTYHRTVWLFRSDAEIEGDITTSVRRCVAIIRGYHEAIPVPELVVKAAKMKVPKSPESGEPDDNTGARDVEHLLVAHRYRSQTEYAGVEHEIAGLYLGELGRMQASSENPDFASLDGQQVAQLLVDNWSAGDLGFLEKMRALEAGERSSQGLSSESPSPSRALDFDTRLGALERGLQRRR